jgi:hypothetical protein
MEKSNLSSPDRILYRPHRRTKFKPIISKYKIKGVAYCSWCCENKVSPGRRKYCNVCVESSKLLTRMGSIRHLVLLRDRVCQICGLASPKYVNSKHKLYEKLLALGYRMSSPIYEVDHIIPKCEGGDHMDENNLRLLCQICHKKETKLLRQRMKS